MYNSWKYSSHHLPSFGFPASSPVNTRAISHLACESLHLLQNRLCGPDHRQSMKTKQEDIRQTGRTGRNFSVNPCPGAPNTHLLSVCSIPSQQWFTSGLQVLVPNQILPNNSQFCRYDITISTF